MTTYMIALPYLNSDGNEYCVDTSEGDYKRLVADGVYHEVINTSEIRVAWPKALLHTLQGKSAAVDSEKG